MEFKLLAKSLTLFRISFSYRFVYKTMDLTWIIISNYQYAKSSPSSPNLETLWKSIAGPLRRWEASKKYWGLEVWGGLGWHWGRPVRKRAGWRGMCPRWPPHLPVSQASLTAEYPGRSEQSHLRAQLASSLADRLTRLALPRGQGWEGNHTLLPDVMREYLCVRMCGEGKKERVCSWGQCTQPGELRCQSPTPSCEQRSERG